MNRATVLLVPLAPFLLAGLALYGWRNVGDVSSVDDAMLASAGRMFAAGTAPSGTPIDPETISQKAPPPPDHTELYRNEKYGFSYYHSPNAKVTEYDEGGGAMTLVHENFEKVRGFQVFIVPYNEPTISEERFRADVPSGVRENVENAELDGVRAVTFNSYDATLGETREIWVIHNGYLYEITTMKGVGNWFTPIIQSWDFF